VDGSYTDYHLSYYPRYPTRSYSAHWILAFPHLDTRPRRIDELAIQGRISEELVEYLPTLRLFFQIRKTTSDWSDKRMALISECLGGMKVVKWFCYENRFLDRTSPLPWRAVSDAKSDAIGISNLRVNELKGVWKIETYGSTK
jgi:hypothetical protein